MYEYVITSSLAIGGKITPCAPCMLLFQIRLPVLNTQLNSRVKEQYLYNIGIIIIDLIRYGSHAHDIYFYVTLLKAIMICIEQVRVSVKFCFYLAKS